MRENTKATSLEFWSCSDLAKILTMVENFLRVCAAFGAENGRIAIWGDRPKFCWRAADQDQDAADGHENLAEASGTEKRFAGAPLPRSLKVLEPLSGPTCHANPPRSQKVQSGSTGNANTPRSQKSPVRADWQRQPPAPLLVVPRLSHSQ